MTTRPPFLDRLEVQLHDGAARVHERRTRRRRVLGSLTLAAAATWGLIVVSGDDGDPGLIAAPPPTVDETSPATSTPITTEPAAASDDDAATNGRCRSGSPDDDTGLRADSLVSRYNRYDADGIIALLGDGPVRDPSLDPTGDGRFASVGAWIEAARSVSDRLEPAGHSPGEPIVLYTARSNTLLADNDIERVSFVMTAWAQDCEVRVETSGEVSAPDPCRYAATFDQPPTGGCADRFEPRRSHAAVWTGNELLVVGGASGTHEQTTLVSGIALDPATGESRAIADAPIALAPWPRSHSFWTGDRLITVGRSEAIQEDGVYVQVYDPTRDTWAVSPPLVRNSGAVGAAVFTGTDVLLVGGDINMPADDAWSYSLAEDRWSELPSPAIAPTEGIVGVWTGNEAVFVGGYSSTTNATVSYDPATRSWTSADPLPIDGWLQGHEMVWTGREIVVASGHAGPAHRGGWLLFDPATDTWRDSAPLPILAGERVGLVWTGTDVVVWGGYGTYGANDDDGDDVYGEGAAYDPTTDTWRVLSPSPLSDRCQHSATWTGEEVVVFGGLERCGDPNVLARGDAAAFDPTDDTWRAFD